MIHRLQGESIWHVKLFLKLYLNDSFTFPEEEFSLVSGSSTHITEIAQVRTEIYIISYI